MVKNCLRYSLSSYGTDLALTSDSWPECKRAKPPSHVSQIPVSGPRSRPCNQPAAAVLIWLHHREFNYLYTVLWSQQKTGAVPPKPDPTTMCQHPLRCWKVVNFPRLFKILTWSIFKSLREGNFVHCHRTLESTALQGLERGCVHYPLKE